MASVDERVVAMSFENAKFEQALAQTIASLTKLSNSLKTVGGQTGFNDIEKAANKVTLTGPMSALDKLKQKLGFAPGSTKGITDIENAGNKVTLSGPQRAIEKVKGALGRITGAGAFTQLEREASKVDFRPLTSQIDSISPHFSAMQVAAVAAFSTLVSKISAKAAQLTKSLSLDGIVGGFKEYSTNLNSIQTILANTKQSGANLKDVNRTLLELNRYSDQTIYNFSEMAKNIGTFTAAGVDLKTATGSIKGIANLAALSGSNSQQAATAMYQLSQAISSGRVSLQDWNSVVNAGMGGTVFQRALAQTAVAMGKIDKNALTLHGKMKNVRIEGESFRESIMAAPGKQSWLTSDVLTNTLKQFTGDLSVAELKAQGFNDAQIKAIQSTAKTAKAAATEVKTISQVWDVAKETIGSGWSQTFQLIFGNFTEAKKTFTALSQAINGSINASANHRNKVLGDWKALGGRTYLLQGIKNLFEAIGSVLKPIRDAFRQIFPATTGKELFELTKRFAEFAKSLAITPETAKNLKRTFAGLFAVLHIGFSIIKGVIGLFGKLLGAVGKGSGGFLNFTGSIGDFLVSLDKALTKGGAIQSFFDTIAAAIKTPIKLLLAFTGLIRNAFDGIDGNETKKFGDDMQAVGVKVAPIKRIIDTVTKAFNGLVQAFHDVNHFLQPFYKKIDHIVDDFKDKVAEAFKNADYDKVFSVIQTTLVGGIFLMVKKALGGVGVDLDLTGGLFKNINKTLGSLTGNLKAMQHELQAKTLLEIAAAILALAVGIKLLSKIDPKALTKAMTAVAVGMGQLVGALFLLSKATSGAGVLAMPLLAASMIGLSVAVTILAAAVKIFSTLSWDGLIKGLVGVGGAITAIGIGMKTLGPSTIVNAVAITVLAGALNLLALAVKQFAQMSWGDMIKGLIGVTGALVGIGIATKLMGPSLSLVAPGLLVISFSLTMLAAAVGAFGALNLGTMAKGLLGISASLVAIGIAVGLIPKTVAIQAAGLVILGIALTGIAGAIGVMGKLNIGTMVKGIAALAATLIVLAAGLTAMSGTFVGSAALMATALALTLLAPTLGLLGSMDIKTIAIGLGAIAAVMGTIAVVGALASAPISALGFALMPLGIGLALISGALWIFVQALMALGTTGVSSLAAITSAMTAFFALLPKIAVEFIKGVISVIEEAAKVAPEVVDAFVKIINAVLDVIIKSSPKMAAAMSALIQAFLKVVNDNAPRIIDTGIRLLLYFLKGVDQNISKIVSRAASIAVKFMNGLAAKAPALIASGTRLLLQFLKGIADNIVRVVNMAARVAINFVIGIANNIPQFIAAGARAIVNFLKGIANQIPNVIKAGVRIVTKTLDGISSQFGAVARTATRFVVRFFQAFGNKENVERMVDAGLKAALHILQGIASGIKKDDNLERIVKAAFDIGWAIVKGIAKGLAGIPKMLGKKLLGPLKGAVNDVGDFLGINSPSKKFIEIGGYIQEGMAIGLDRGAPGVNMAMHRTASDLVGTAKKAFGGVPSLLDGVVDLDPTIRPVLDLTQVESEASKLKDMTNVTPITAAASFNQASSISADTEAAREAVALAATNAGPEKVEFNQYNTSPEALSNIDIYRQTRNQLSQLKGVLGLPA